MQFLAETAENSSTLIQNRNCIFFNETEPTTVQNQKPWLFQKRNQTERQKTFYAPLLDIVTGILCSAQQKMSLLSTTVLQNIGISRHYEILYNLGIELLHCGQPQLAFDCLLETLQLYQVNPLLWLRLAECCIMTHRVVWCSHDLACVNLTSFQIRDVNF